MRLIDHTSSRLSPNVKNLAVWLLVTVAGMYFVVLGALAFAARARAERFLMGFAQTARTHLLELVIRLVVGWAFVNVAVAPPLANIYRVFGWVLIVTSLILALLPWRLHQRFAAKAVPQALGFMPLIGASSLIMGFVILLSV